MEEMEDSPCNIPPNSRIVYWHTLNLHQYIILKKTKNVSCEYDRWVVETQLWYLKKSRKKKAEKRNSSCQIEDFVEVHVCELRMNDNVGIRPPLLYRGNLFYSTRQL